MLLSLALAAATTPQDSRAPLLIDRDRIDRPRAPIAPTRKSKQAAPTKVAAQGSDIVITGIRFRGSKAPAVVAAASKPFLGRRADTATLQALAAALSDAYAGSDVALYTVAIPEQDFAGGAVTVLLTEATIIKASVRGPAGSHPRLRERLARMMAEKPLSRRTFERQLTLIRAIPGLTFDPEIADPAGNGELTMTVTPKQRRTKASLGFSNRGIDLLGDGQFDAKFEAYGTLRDGDQATISASAARDLRRYRYVGAAYAVPVSPGGLTLGANAAYLETRPRDLPITGRAKLAGLTLTDPILRDFHQSADVSIGIDGIDSDNAVFSNIIASERTRAIRLAGSFSSTRERTSVAVSGSLSKGLDILGARVTAPFARSDFAKTTLAASVGQAIGKRGVVRVNLSGQYARDALPAAERFAIGGEAIGRAFDTGLLSGDRGFGGLAEVAWRPVRAVRFQTSEIYGFVDGGRVGIVPRGAMPGLSYDLASTGLGGRLRFRDKAEVGVEAARTLDDPYPGHTDDWRVSVAWRLSL